MIGGRAVDQIAEHEFTDVANFEDSVLNELIYYSEQNQLLFSVSLTKQYGNELLNKLLANHLIARIRTMLSNISAKHAIIKKMNK
jgi:hypothetical protein